MNTVISSLRTSLIQLSISVLVTRTNTESSHTTETANSASTITMHENDTTCSEWNDRLIRIYHISHDSGHDFCCIAVAQRYVRPNAERGPALCPRTSAIPLPTPKCSNRFASTWHTKQLHSFVSWCTLADWINLQGHDGRLWTCPESSWLLFHKVFPTIKRSIHNLINGIYIIVIPKSIHRGLIQCEKQQVMKWYMCFFDISIPRNTIWIDLMTATEILTIYYHLKGKPWICIRRIHVTTAGRGFETTYQAMNRLKTYLRAARNEACSTTSKMDYVLLFHFFAIVVPILLNKSWTAICAHRIPCALWSPHVRSKKNQCYHDEWFGQEILWRNPDMNRKNVVLGNWERIQQELAL